MKRVGWGHSSVEACVVTAVAAGVKALHVGHRDPRRSDGDLAKVEAFIQRLLREELHKAGQAGDAVRTLIPFEGMQVCI